MRGDLTKGRPGLGPGRRSPAPLEAADDDEEQGRDDAVGEVAAERSLKADLAAGGQSEDHEAHVRHRRVGDQALEVTLDEADQSTPEDRDGGGDGKRPAR